ncbi:NACHT, LRR and PYD domains-containing protein 1b allele 3-like isoform 2-T2 [Anomaloglossus baeobatrachus]|uniref:NACHT, LRR and PYD domains-containing protein 1b allele 3-like isoform X2 n=1 Tax=Anomaloglossus baeobatrachus TaxID=238106 RepID=UPI003F4F6D3A
MKEPYRETTVGTLSTKLIAGLKMAAGPPVKVNGPSGLTPQVIGHNTYRIEVCGNAGDQPEIHCPETGIKFKVESGTTVEYSLEYGDDYINLIQELGYELLGPIFNVRVLSGDVSAVHLPHYVCLEGLKDKSKIKFGHFKDGKVSLKIPSVIDPSYVVLNHPTFSCVAPIGERVMSFLRRVKPYPFSGKVVLYVRVLCADNHKLKELRIHLYLIPADRHRLKKLDECKGRLGFKNIDKPGAFNNVFTKTNYIISGKPTPSIFPPKLQFLIHKEIEDYGFTEINISHSAEEISLKVREESPGSEPLWQGLLTRADIEELSVQAAQKVSPEFFINEHHPELIQKVRNIEPVLDELKKLNLLTQEACDRVMSKETSQDKMREVFKSVDGWSREDTETFYQVVKRHNKSIIKAIQKEA